MGHEVLTLDRPEAVTSPSIKVADMPPLNTTAERNRAQTAAEPTGTSGLGRGLFDCLAGPINRRIAEIHPRPYSKEPTARVNLERNVFVTPASVRAGRVHLLDGILVERHPGGTYKINVHRTTPGK